MSTSSAATSSTSATKSWLLLASILLLAATIRAPITSLGPVLLDIQSALGIDARVAGLLHATPLVIFAVVALAAPAIGRKMGIARAIWFALILIVAGTTVRSISGAGLIWLGTAALSTGIAICNVLLPGFVKQKFGAKGPGVIGLYVAAMAVMAGVATGVAVPIATAPGFDWHWSIGIWAIPALAALLLWLPQLKTDAAGTQAKGTSMPAASPWASSKGWQIAIFFALHSFVFYCVIDWYTAYASVHAISPATAGLYLLLYQIVSTVANITTGPMIKRQSDQAAMGFACGLVMVAGSCGLLFQPELSIVWMVLLGLSAGVSMVLSISLFGLRTHSPEQAAKVSGMAQFFGYAIAALGQVGVGMLHETSQSWTGPLVLMVAASVGVMIFAAMAGRTGYVE